MLIRRLVSLSVAFAGMFAVLIAPGVATAGAVPTLKKQIQYVVIPHPDDETESWAMIANSSQNYPVFMLMTQGDHTGFCGHEEQLRAYQPLAGELPPIPEPAFKDFAACDLARVNSWNLFLDQMAVIDPFLDVPAFVGTFPLTVPCGDCSRPERSPEILSPQGCKDGVLSRVPAMTYDLYVGVSSARMVFNFGDCDLTAGEVSAAVRQARANTKAGLLPLKQEYGIIGASFYNKQQGTGCSFYDHPDHGAIHVALYNVDFGTPGPQ